MKTHYINYKADIKRLDTVQTDIESLLVTYKKITPDELALCLTYFPNLVKIQITYTTLDAFPSEIFEMENLQWLTSDGNPITKIPDEIGKLKNIIVFGLTKSKLDYISDALYDLPLQSLDFAENNLTEFPEGIKKLTNLQYLKLSDNKIEHIPDEYFEQLYPTLIKLWFRNNKLESFPLKKEYPNLDYLDLTNNNITEWNDIDSGFPKLQMLELFECKLNHIEFHHDYSSIYQFGASWNELKEFPQGIEHLKPVQFLKLEGNQFTSIPEEINQLQSLLSFTYDKSFVQNAPKHAAKLNLSYEEDFTNSRDPNIPLSTFQNAEAKYLVLDNIDNPILPDDIPENCRISIVHMRNCKMKTLPKNIDKLPNLLVLDISDNEFTELPKELANCKRLETLKIGKNKLQTFAGYDTIKSLTSIDIYKNPCINNIEDLMSKRSITVDGFNWDSINMHKKIFLPFAAALKKSKLTDEEKLEYLNMVKYQSQVSLPMDSFEDRIKALCIPFRAEEMKARELIFGMSDEEIKKRPLNDSSILYIAGKPSQKKTEIKAQCKDLGIKIENKYTDKVTHILLGRSPNELLGIKESNAVFIPESAISNLHKGKNPEFLETADNDTVNKVRTLLRSKAKENITLAYEMLKNGGVPQELYFDILYVIKTQSGWDVLNKLSKLIKPLLPQQLEGVLKSRAKLDRLDEKESDIIQKLRKNEPVWGKEFCLYMSLELFKERKHGARYLMLNTEINDLLRLDAINLMQEDELLNWHSAYGFHHDWWRESKRRRAYNIPFPIEIEDKTQIKKLNLRRCKLHELPAGMEQFTSLQAIDLCTNGLKDLPKWFANLQSLEILDLSDNYLTMFPKVLYNLPNLKKVIFGKQNITNYNTKYNFIDVPEHLSKDFPNVEFVFKVDEKTYYSCEETSIN